MRIRVSTDRPAPAASASNVARANAEGTDTPAHAAPETIRRELHHVRDTYRKVVREIECAAAGCIDPRGAHGAIGHRRCVHEREDGSPAREQREEAGAHHPSKSRHQLPVALAVDHRGANGGGPQLARGVRAKHEVLSLALGARVVRLLGKRREWSVLVGW